MSEHTPEKVPNHPQEVDPKPEDGKETVDNSGEQESRSPNSGSGASQSTSSGNSNPSA